MFDSVWRAVYSTLSPAGANARHSTLIFHRVLAEPDPLLPDEPRAADFEKRMRWVQRHFNVIPLTEAVARLHSNSLPTRSLSVTFDDGYADNQHVAAPILSKLGIPATFFIASGYLDGGCMFNDSIIAAVRGCKRTSLDLTVLGLGVHSLESPEQLRGAISVLLSQIKGLHPVDRASRVQRICQLAEVGSPDALMMTSSQVAALARDGFEIGAHTVNHPILARLDPNAARDEIHQGRLRLEQITRGPVRLFAYPNGKPGEDYTAQTTGLVRQLGFAAAFTTAHGVASCNADLFQLPRFTPWDRGNMKFGARMARNMLKVNPLVEETARQSSTLGPENSGHAR
ncbi:MAG: polysaccharide deacetylase family protein [Pseudomonadota bacterium]|nr:polysaccharide deacetylase family protein [Pseudomonadota bacterium]